MPARGRHISYVQIRSRALDQSFLLGANPFYQGLLLYDPAESTFSYLCLISDWQPV